MTRMVAVEHYFPQTDREEIHTPSEFLLDIHERRAASIRRLLLVECLRNGFVGAKRPILRRLVERG